jgi:hypothetical protein
VRFADENITVFLMQLDLDHAERAALIAVLTGAIPSDRLPLWPHVRMLLSILEKLDPQPVQGKPSESLRCADSAWSHLRRQPALSD